MTEVTEEVMDSPALSEEEAEEQKLSSEGGDARQSQSGAAAGGDMIQGKRVKKTVERLDFQAPKQREKLRVGDGCGEKLGEIPRTNYQITKMKPADLKPLHTVLFDRPGKMASIKKNLRLFNGFSFDSDSEQFNKKREKMLKSSNFTNSKLKVMCSVLDLEKKGTHSDLVDRILTFLTSPKSSGKRLLIKKKKKSKKKLSGDDTAPQVKKKKNKPKASSSSSSPKKSKAGNKSKAIVMDSSSDEDQDEEEEEEAGALAEEKPSEREENSSEEESEEEASKSKSGRTSSTSKKQTGKRPRTAGKKSSAPRKRMKKSSDQSSSQSKSESESQSESESDNQQQAQKKKPLAKTKKADSSSNSKNTHTAEDSSDEDEPLIKMIKKAPSDDQLKETLQNLLKEADLEEMTMKQICQRVFDLYPEHDLSSRKDFIKQTVRALLT